PPPRARAPKSVPVPHPPRPAGLAGWQRCCSCVPRAETMQGAVAAAVEGALVRIMPRRPARAGLTLTANRWRRTMKTLSTLLAGFAAVALAAAPVVQAQQPAPPGGA